MLKKFLQKRTQDESGVTLLTLVGVSLVVFALIASVMSSVALNTYSTNVGLAQEQTHTLADNIATNGARAFTFSEDREYCESAVYVEHGFFQIFVSDNDAPPAGTSDEGVRRDCPQEDDQWLIVQGYATGVQDTSSISEQVYKIIPEDDFSMGSRVISAASVVFSEATVTNGVGSIVKPTIYAESSPSSRLICSNGGVLDANYFTSGGDVEHVIRCEITGNVVAEGSTDIVISSLNESVGSVGGYICSGSGEIEGDSENMMVPHHLQSADCVVPHSLPLYAPASNVLSDNDITTTISSANCPATVTELEFLINGLEDSVRVLDARACSDQFGNTAGVLGSDAEKEILLERLDTTILLNEISVQNLVIGGISGASLNFVDMKDPSDSSDLSSRMCPDTDQLCLLGVKNVSGTSSIFTSQGDSRILGYSEVNGWILSAGDAQIYQGSKIFYSPSSLPAIQGGDQDLPHQLIRVL